MIFYFLITVVFISEVIIAVTIITHLYKWHMLITEANDFVTEAKPKIKSISEIGCKISEQLLELAPTCVSKVKLFVTELLFDNIVNIISGLLFLKAGSTIRKK